MDKFTNLTRYEAIGINQVHNLADGHAHQLQNETQQQIVSRLPDIFYTSEASKQKVLEEEFQHHFYKLAGQHSAIDHPRTMLCYSASLSTDLVATYLTSENLTVSLLQPCFDNLATILARRHVALTSVSEEELLPERMEETIAKMETDALFITLPNNPTGFVLPQAAVEQLIRLCVRYDKLLIIDCTFRFYSEHMFWDQYALLESSGVRYIVVEDTGKTWPTQDLKCSILAVSADLYPKVLELHNDILLNVSPFILKLLTEYVKDSEQEGLDKTIWNIIDQNRANIRNALQNSILKPHQTNNTRVSVEWLEIVDPEINSHQLLHELDQAGFGLLPGDHFYWQDPQIGERFVRVALARDPEQFAESCRQLQQFIEQNEMLRVRV